MCFTQKIFSGTCKKIVGHVRDNYFLRGTCPRQRQLLEMQMASLQAQAQAQVQAQAQAQAQQAQMQVRVLICSASYFPS